MQPLVTQTHFPLSETITAHLDPVRMFAYARKGMHPKICQPCMDLWTSPFNAIQMPQWLCEDIQMHAVSIGVKANIVNIPEYFSLN